MSIDRKDDALRHQTELRFLVELLAKSSDYLTEEVRNYVQFGNKLHYDNFWSKVNKTRSRDMVVEKLKSLKVFPENLKYIEIAKEYSDNLIKTEKETMKEVKAGNYRAARELVFSEYYAGQKKLIMENIGNFQSVINKIAFDRTRETESNAELFINLTYGLIILSVLLVLLFFYFIGIKQLVQPINSLTSLMLKMAQGNLDEKIPNISQNQNNEIGAMGLTLEFLKSSLIKQNQEEESVQKERQRFLNMLDQLPVSFHLQASDYTWKECNSLFPPS
jgi:methyl-accepting chemotaxis protein